jgi:hypothetical protein
VVRSFLWSLWLIGSQFIPLSGLGQGFNLATFKCGFYYYDYVFETFNIKG